MMGFSLYSNGSFFYLTREFLVSMNDNIIVKNKKLKNMALHGHLQIPIKYRD